MIALQKASKAEQMQHQAAASMGSAIAKHFAQRAGSLAPHRVIQTLSPTSIIAPPQSETREDTSRNISPVKSNQTQHQNKTIQWNTDIKAIIGSKLMHNIQNRPNTTANQNQRRGSNTPSQIDSSRFASPDQNLNRVFSSVPRAR